MTSFLLDFYKIIFCAALYKILDIFYFYFFAFIFILDLIYLFNGMSIPYGLFNVEIWFIFKCL